MDEKIPEPLRALAERLSKLPGLGPKSAVRAVMTLLKWPESETRSLGKGIWELRDAIRLCPRCGALTENELCAVCADPSRDESILCVVSEWDGMLALESGGFYKGRYFILGEGFSPFGDPKDERLETERLAARLAEGATREVVLALGATVEAETAGALLKSMIARRFPEVRVTRLAQGIPLGGEVKFMDKETLRQSLEHRQDLS